MPPVIDESKCTRCGWCVEICAEDIFYGYTKKTVPRVVHPEMCAHCNCCVYECPVEGAIQLRIPLPLMLLYK